MMMRFSSRFAAAVLALAAVSTSLVVHSLELSQDESDWILKAADLSNRIYFFKSSDTFDPTFETYWESANRQDAVLLAEYDQDCIVAFRGTKVLRSTETEFVIDVLPDLVLAGLADSISNANTINKPFLSNIDDQNVGCLVGEGFYNAYFNDFVDEMETAIAQQCVNQGKRLIFTGHSQGAALAQLAAVRYSHYQKYQIYGFAPAPAFFDDCPSVPDSKMLMFVNTEQDGGRFETETPVEFDIVPFVDVFVRSVVNAQLLSLIVWTLTPPGTFETIRSNPESFFIGSYKGPYVVLNPNPELPSSAAFVNSRSEMIETEAISLDVFDWQEFFDFSSPFGERIISAHNMQAYQDKLEHLIAKNDNRLVANGFESFTDCNPGSPFMCKGFCPDNALCSNGQVGEPCWEDEDCDSDLCYLVLDDIPVFRCGEPRQYGEFCFPGQCGEGMSCFFGTCLDGRLGDRCNWNSNCQSGRCNSKWGELGFFCVEKKAKGSWCNSDADCQSGDCFIRCQ